MDLHADRHGRAHACDRDLEVPAQADDVAAFAHGDGQADGFLAVEMHLAGRRVDETARDRRDVAEAKTSAVDLDADVGDRFDRVEFAGYAQRDTLLTGLNDSGRIHAVGVAKGLFNQRGINRKRRQLRVRGLHEDALVLYAEVLDLADVVDAQKFVAGLIDEAAQLGLVETIAGEGVQVAERVAEFVVEERALHALRKCLLDVTDLLADLVPDIGNPRGRHILAKIDRDLRLARFGVAELIIDFRDFLELFLDAVGHLQGHLARVGAGPARLYDHGLDRERRIFHLSQVGVGKDSAGAQQEDKEQHERLMLERPGRKIETTHGSALPRRMRVGHPHLLAFMQQVHAGRHDALPIGQARADEDGVLAHVRQGDPA